jgi:hypothetical protein
MISDYDEGAIHQVHDTMVSKYNARKEYENRQLRRENHYLSPDCFG